MYDDRGITEISKYKYWFLMLWGSKILIFLCFLKVFEGFWRGRGVELLLRKEGNNPDCPHIIRTSFTGSAASAIEGQTLHSSFALNFSGASESLDDKKRDKMRHVLKNLRVILLDEFR